MDSVKQALHQRNKQKWKQIILDCRRSGLSDSMYNEDKSDASERTELVVEYHGASITVSASTPMDLFRRTLAVMKDALS